MFVSRKTLKLNIMDRLFNVCTTHWHGVYTYVLGSIQMYGGKRVYSTKWRSQEALNNCFFFYKPIHREHAVAKIEMPHLKYQEIIDVWFARDPQVHERLFHTPRKFLRWDSALHICVSYIHLDVYTTQMCGLV